MGDKKKILFLCTGNSIRSQMAEGFCRAFSGGKLDVYSAGVSPSSIHPITMEVMKEEGIDISDQTSSSIGEVPFHSADHVITLCDHAQSVCPPVPSSVDRRHWSIKDPISTLGTSKEILDAFRATREDVQERVKRLVEELLEK